MWFYVLLVKKCTTKDTHLFLIWQSIKWTLSFDTCKSEREKTLCCHLLLRNALRQTITTVFLIFHFTATIPAITYALLTGYYPIFPQIVLGNGQCLLTDDALFLLRLCYVRENLFMHGIEGEQCLSVATAFWTVPVSPTGYSDSNKDGCNKSAIHDWLRGLFPWMAPMMRKCAFWCLLALR